MIDEKSVVAHPPPSSYGNMPLEVSQSGSSVNPEDKKNGKFEEHGKKIGKKFGNAGRLSPRCISPSIHPITCVMMILTCYYSDLRCRCYRWFQHCKQHFLIYQMLGVCRPGAFSYS